MRTHHDKLIRDLIPEVMDAAGVRYRVETMDDAAYQQALRAKVVEEAREIAAAPPEDLVREIADLYEVLDALVRAEGLEATEVRVVQERRRDERGGFGARLRLVWTES